jgi:MtN3 and saliva related transmembrane protein
MEGHHHLNLRKRIFKKLEPYPHPESLKRLLDKTMVFIAVVGPLATLPQVFQVFSTQDAKGLSLITWSLWTVLSFLWCIYGAVHKETPIVVSNAIYIVLQGAVIVAIFLYS